MFDTIVYVTMDLLSTLSNCVAIFVTDPVSVKSDPVAQLIPDIP